MEFKEKRVLITGAAGIFGSWTSKAFAKQGAQLFLVDSREAPLKELCQTKSLQNVEVLTHATNLRESHSIAALVDEVKQKWETPDIVINCAGIYPSKRFLDMTREDWDAVIDINLSAAFEVIQSFAKLMIQHDIHGTMINFSSGSAARARLGAAHYAVSKAGIDMLTKAAALELAPYNIRINAVSPGFAPGSQVSHLSQEYVDIMKRGIPLQRTSGPEDVPEAILFLCSDKASYITGTTLIIDGGSSAGNASLPLSLG
ncbi:3-oxoacyl-[acyl-carrier-protein] reductase FabG [Pullulanibacillus camelliae]|uniref:3-oxoacyl-[acyl-carrier-protein] reductase FabG n=1 Tax=Pullulanibacillus camelliae TaxID=1707096 RepID=A0A8J3DX74_9BACL|nr:SDR family NAD(P)-dependent oxidoreductase [Pullulanibacillus camelliae]GGE45085.1 3-oxoacyl-[acyl-carrier-protein] reductase FabG [Pullulanibacillus camelliae]